LLVAPTLEENTMGFKGRMVCGLDVGTWKTCLVVALAHRDHRLQMIASGYSSSSGLAKGAIVDPSEVVKSIRRAVDDARAGAKISVNSVIAGISGVHIQSHRFHGSVPIQGKHGEITAEDMQNAIHAASIPLFPQQEVIHVLPQEFFVNGHGGIKNPVGLAGSQLEVDLHVITGNDAQCQSLVNAVNKSRIEVRRIILKAIASGAAVLTPEEQELGAVIIDIGGGTTNIAVFVKGSISFVSVIAAGGIHFTRDLVEALCISREEAERIKIDAGNVLPDLIAPEEVVSVQGLGLRGQVNYSRREICRYLHDRGAELMELVLQDLRHSGVRKDLVAGAVITGGGSMMAGMTELAESILDMPVRQGVPLGFEKSMKELAHPAYACAIGLAVLEAQKGAPWDFQDKPPSKPSMIDRILSFL
jgi:cell division protein FtsA